MRHYLNTTAHNDMSGPALSMYLAEIDVMDYGRNGHGGTMIPYGRHILPNAGPIAGWVAETIMDVQLLGGELNQRAIY